MNSLKQKTISGFFWSFLEFFSRQGIAFLIGIVLARLLTPRDFGLVGMLVIFITVSQTLTDSGFSQALIRKKHCNDADFSTIFFFNIGISIFAYALLFLFAGGIANIFDEPILKPMVRVLGLSVVVNSFSIIQKTQLTRNINFKLQAKITIIASLVAGSAGLFLAFVGFGVWSLVFKTLATSSIISALLWFWNSWRPIWVFNKKSFNELFSFGSKLLVNGLLNVTYKNVYYFIIGKYFSATDLGFFKRAEIFTQLPSSSLTSVLTGVSYPVLSQMQDDNPRLKANFKKMVQGSTLLSFVMMFGMAVIAEPMVITLIGEQWRPSIIYLQLLCFAGAFYPLHALNLNILKVKGRSDLFLKLSLIRKLFVIPVVFVGVVWGIEYMIINMIINTIIIYFINSYYSSRLIGYRVPEQLKDIAPAFLLAVCSNIIIFFLGVIIQLPNYIVLIVQLISGLALALLLSELFQIKGYQLIKEIVYSKIKELKNARK